MIILCFNDYTLFQSSYFQDSDVMCAKNKYTQCLAKDAGTGPCSKWHNRRFCRMHDSQYRAGRIDINGKEIRKQKTNKIYNGCTLKHSGECTGYRKGRFCIKHYYQYHAKPPIIDYDGNKLRDKIDKKIFHGCLSKNSGLGECSTSKFKGRFCHRHRGMFNQGIINKNGKKLREPIWGKLRKKCNISGCKQLSGFFGLCRNHYYEIIQRGWVERYPEIIPVSKYNLRTDGRKWHE